MPADQTKSEMIDHQLGELKTKTITSNAPDPEKICQHPTIDCLCRMCHVNFAVEVGLVDEDTTCRQHI